MGWKLEMPIPELISTPERMLQVCRQIKDTGICALDTETTGLNVMKDIILFWSLCPNLNERFCLTRDMIPIFEQEVSRNPNIIWIMTKANYDTNILVNSGVPTMAGPVHCTLVMDWLHNENRLGRHGLKETALDHLGLNMRQFKSVFKKRAKETYQDTLLRMWDQERDNAIDYASMDAWSSLAVWRYLKKKLMDEPTVGGINLWDIFVNIEVPYTKVLHNCIRRGIMVDVGYLEDRKAPIDADLKKLARNINKIVGREINPLSPKELQKIFFEELGYTPVKYTSGGQSGNRRPSLDESTLKVFSSQGDPLSNLILDYRGLIKTKSTYIDGMIKCCDSHYRIHPTLNQHIVVTGRLSSVNPSLLNLPRPDEDEYQIRGAFMPDSDYTIVAGDYKQVEMRLLAVFANDKKMQEVIKNGWDIHMGTASIMFGVPYEEIVKAKKAASKLEKDKTPREKWPERVKELMGYRQTSKTIGFGQQRGRKETCSKRGNLSAAA